MTKVRQTEVVKPAASKIEKTTTTPVKTNATKPSPAKLPKSPGLTVSKAKKTLVPEINSSAEQRNFIAEKASKSRKVAVKKHSARKSHHKKSNGNNLTPH